MGLLVSTVLTWTPFEGSAGRVWFFESSIINSPFLVGPVGMWAKASISRLFELARETGEAEPVGAADRPHIHRRFLPIVQRRDQGFWVMIRGELAMRRGTSIARMRRVPRRWPPRAGPQAAPAHLLKELLTARSVLLGPGRQVQQRLLAVRQDPPCRRYRLARLALMQQSARSRN